MSDKQTSQAQPDVAGTIKTVIDLANDALNSDEKSASIDVLKLQCTFSKMSLEESRALMIKIDLGHLNDSAHVPVAEPEYHNDKLTAIVFDHYADADKFVRVNLQDKSACHKVRPETEK